MDVKVPPEGQPPKRSRFRRIARFVLGNLGLTILLLFLVEGAAGYLVLIRELFADPVAADDSKHTRYDPDLGWVNVPNALVADMYGPGIAFRSNGQGFRNREEITPAVPAGKVRIICSGDSFTMGQGVGDEESWCHQLNVLDPRLETVNMGQAGYGVDQAYLWAKRDAAGLERQIHLLAFITANIHRMQRSSHHGYAKPVLAIEDGELIARNTPVPRASYRWRWTLPLIQAARGLSTYRLAAWAVRKVSPPTSDGSESALDAETKEVLRLLLADLRQENERHGAKLVLVHLPTIGELAAGGPPRQWREFIRHQADSLDLLLIDLYEPVLALPQLTTPALFLPDEHYNPRGHALIARLVLEELRRDLRTAQALAVLSSVRTSR